MAEAPPQGVDHVIGDTVISTIYIAISDNEGSSHDRILMNAEKDTSG
jgi:hypothetical protein